MVKSYWRAVLPIGVLALAGCSAMNRSECQVSDWRAVGFEDGAKGASVARIGEYRKACSKYQVAPDLEAYRAGYAEGVSSYCREANGFNVGSRGVVYQGICPAESEEGFLTGYRSGFHLYELNVAVDSLSGQIASKHQSLHQLKEQLDEKKASLLDKNTPDSERALLASDIYNLGRQRGKLENEIEALQRELGARQEELARYRESLALNR